MNVSRTRQVTINMGHWGEKYQAGATTTVSHADLGYTDEEWRERAQTEDIADLHRELSEVALAAVNDQLEIEIVEAMRVRDADEPSFMDGYEHPENPKRKTRRKRN